MSRTPHRTSGREVAPSSRRELLRRGFLGASALALSPLLTRCGDEEGRGSLADVGPLGGPDANGLRLPPGFTSRVLATAGVVVPGTNYEWHAAPDGGATFPMDDGGWVYVSNAELIVNGGAGALRFDAGGNVVDAYRILDGTLLNCAGGATPWGTWLSCEEHNGGHVFECDPTGATDAIERAALGTFKHEAVAVDPTTGILYMTEDQPDGRFYRYVPDQVDGVPDLTAGTLEVLRIESGNEGSVVWETVPDPDATTDPTREQVPTSTAFAGGEGVAYHAGIVYFTTKGDNRVWAYSVADESIEVVYDAEALDAPVLTGVDNLAITSRGDLLVCEDGGGSDMQVVAITSNGTVVPIAQVEGHDGSEVTGIAIDPSGTRIYFSSQRGESGIIGVSGGVTYEVRLPFAV